jgi:hypothetical protein
MTVYITAVSPGTADDHGAIAKVKWLNSADSTSSNMTTQQAVEWIRGGNELSVAGPGGAVEVRVVNATPPHLRTVANGKWADNLLSLPRF